MAKESYTDAQVTSLVEKWCPPEATVVSAGSRDTWRVYIDKTLIAQLYCTGHCDRIGEQWWMFSGRWVPPNGKLTYGYGTGEFGRQYFKRRELRAALKEGAKYIRGISKREKLDIEKREQLHTVDKSFHVPLAEVGYIDTGEDETRAMIHMLAVQGHTFEDETLNGVLHNSLIQFNQALAVDLWVGVVTTAYDMLKKQLKEQGEK